METEPRRKPGRPPREEPLPPFSRDRLLALLEYNPETGVFINRVARWSMCKPGTQAGTRKPGGYRLIKLDNTLYKAHRLAWLYVYGEWPTHHIDHINGDPADNRISNLREASYAVNGQNRWHCNRNNQTGYAGVIFNGGKYRARLWFDGKLNDLGAFGTPEEAHAMYLDEKRKRHPGFAG